MKTREKAATGNFASLASPSVSQVSGELQAGRPVAARVDWAGGGAHAVVISGYSQPMPLSELVSRLEAPARAILADEGGRKLS